MKEKMIFISDVMEIEISRNCVDTYYEFTIVNFPMLTCFMFKNSSSVSKWKYTERKVDKCQSELGWEWEPLRYLL